MNKLIYRDLDEFASSLQGLEGDFVPTARPTAEWWIQRSDERCRWVQAFHHGSPATFAGRGTKGTVTLVMPTAVGQFRVNGHVLKSDEVILLQAQQPLTFSSRAAAGWLSIAIPTHTPLIQSDLLIARRGYGPRAQTAPIHLDRLRHLISRVLAKIEGSDASGPGVAMTLEQELARCLTRILEHCTCPPNPHRITKPQLSRRRVLSQSLALLSTPQGEPLFIKDLCQAAQVSERTLRNMFCEYFGVGPMRLLKAIQLQNIRMALLRADPRQKKVSSIAGEFGICDFSLFSRNYKAMYGEPPSRALRAPPSEVRSRDSKLGWLHYASRLVEDRMDRDDSGHSDTPAGLLTSLNLGDGNPEG